MVEKSQTQGWWPNLYDPFRQLSERVADWLAPRSEAKTSNDAYVVTMELPGVAQEDIDLSLHDNMLTVKGEKKTERKEEGEDYYFSEREYGRFQRTFRLPPDADGEKITADLNNGVLKIVVPKRREERGGPKKIKVSGG